MRRLLSGLVCIVALYALCGCASFKNAFSRSSQDSAGKTDQTCSVANPAPNSTETCSSSAGANESTSALIPNTAQTCRIDSAPCIVQAQASSDVTPDPAAPVVQIPEKSFDFGPMRDDKEFTHKFRIKNIGGAELKIKKIIPDCGCRVVNYDKAIPPGGEGAITFSVNSISCASGTKKSILVTCNDPKNPCFFLMLTGYRSL